MVPRTLKRKDAINLLCRKTAFSKENVEKLQISLEGGKVSFSYFMGIVEALRAQSGRSAFSLNNKAEWKCVERRLKEKDILAVLFAEYFSTASPICAEIRAQILKPRTSQTQVKAFLADCLDMDIADLKEDIRVNMLAPSYLPNDYNFYMTMLVWCKERFHKSPPPELVDKGTVKDLMAFYANE